MVAQQGIDHSEHDEYIHLGDPYLWTINERRNPCGTLPLTDIPPSEGWLGDPDTRESPMMAVYPVAQHPTGKDPLQASWVYKDLAYAYSAINTYNEKVALSASPSQLVYRDSDFRDIDLPVTINNAGANTVTFTATIDASVKVSKVELYEYGSDLGSMTGSGGAQTFTVQDLAFGIHSYVALTTDTSGTVYISNAWTVYTDRP